MDETRNCLIEELNQNELISKKYILSTYLYWALTYINPNPRG